jgi:hypothetical protein
VLSEAAVNRPESAVPIALQSTAGLSKNASDDAGITLPFGNAPEAPLSPYTTGAIDFSSHGSNSSAMVPGKATCPRMATERCTLKYRFAVSASECGSSSSSVQMMAIVVDTRDP